MKGDFVSYNKTVLYETVETGRNEWFHPTIGLTYSAFVDGSCLDTLVTVVTWTLDASLVTAGAREQQSIVVTLASCSLARPNVVLQYCAPHTTSILFNSELDIEQL